MFKNITVLEIAEDVEQFFRVSHALQVPNNFILFGRTAGMLNGLCAKLDPELNLIELAKPYASEIPQDRARDLVAIDAARPRVGRRGPLAAAGAAHVSVAG
jgi:predicted unusual protein kinase regulating ubiquinone biosynthesis (AarF/ABC1/UbiB family)